MRAKTPYEKGVSASRRNKLMRDNPYTHETSVQSKKYWEWQRGYIDQETGKIKAPAVDRILQRD